MPETTDKVDSKYRFILVAAKRARQLQGGAKPLVHTTARKPTRIAQEELRAGVIQYEVLAPPSKEEPQPPQEPAASKKSKR